MPRATAVPPFVVLLTASAEKDLAVTALDQGAHCVYCLFDEEQIRWRGDTARVIGTPYYVGISKKPLRRADAHRWESRRTGAMVILRWFTSRREALDVERETARQARLDGANLENRTYRVRSSHALAGTA